MTTATRSRGARDQEVFLYDAASGTARLRLLQPERRPPARRLRHRPNSPACSSTARQRDLAQADPRRQRPRLDPHRLPPPRPLPVPLPLRLRPPLLQRRRRPRPHGHQRRHGRLSVRAAGGGGLHHLRAHLRPAIGRLRQPDLLRHLAPKNRPSSTPPKPATTSSSSPPPSSRRATIDTALDLYDARVGGGEAARRQAGRMRRRRLPAAGGPAQRPDPGLAHLQRRRQRRSNARRARSRRSGKCVAAKKHHKHHKAKHKRHARSSKRAAR